MLSNQEGKTEPWALEAEASNLIILFVFRDGRGV